MKCSLEVEYWVVGDDGDLASPGPLLDLDDRIVPEFVEPMIEIKTEPCESPTALREDLLGRLRRVVDAARERDRRLVPLATPLNAAPAEIPYREKRGTDLQRRIVGPAFDNARFCAGTHVHLEQSGSDASVADQLNALTALDPAFALVTSSSHYRGEWIRACARPYLYRQACYGAFPKQGQLWSYVDDVDEWERRLEAAFERFREAAADRGVDLETFDDEFAPYDAVWTPVRLRESFPTVEWRSPDTALPGAVLDLADAIRSFVERVGERGVTIRDDRRRAGGNSPITAADGRGHGPGPVTLPPFEAVENAVDAAIEDGLAHPDVTDYLRRLGFDTDEYEPLARWLPDRRLSRREARRYRLAAADRLEADLARTMQRV